MVGRKIDWTNLTPLKKATAPMNETPFGVTKNRLIAELSKSPHGSYKEYLPIGQLAAKHTPDFLAHLIAWDATHGQVRDAKVALPIVSLSVADFPEELCENSFAHIAKLNPREFLKAYRFGLETRLPTRMRRLRRLATLYLYQLESEGYWQKVAIQHRAVLRELYALTHTQPGSIANICLFGRTLKKEKMPYPMGSLFDIVAKLKDMSATEAAGMIITKKIPFLIAIGALGKKAKDVDVVLALIKQMTPTELVTNTKMLERLGMKSNPALRGAFDEAMKRTAGSTANILKTTRAAEHVADKELKTKLQGVQEKQLGKIAVEGNWLILGDKSGSMNTAIVAARQVAATLTKLVKGKVWLTFFDTQPTTIDVTGATLDTITAATKYILAGGGTSIGCGLQRMIEYKEEIDGIAIVSDGGENTQPRFWDVYKKYSELFGKEVPVYFYHLVGGATSWEYVEFTNGGDLHIFDLLYQTDFYSLPNLVQTMRTNRYSLVDEIMATPLLKLSDVIKGAKGVTTTHASA